MPTTRQGRYLLYRKRALRKERRANRRNPTVTGTRHPLGNRPTARALDLTGFGKQMPREYPLRPFWPPYRVPVPFPWKQEPGWRVFGVFQTANNVPGVPPADNHPRRSSFDYFFRRVKSLPRFWQLPRKPWRHGLLDVLDANHYPSRYPTYPSGQPNPWYVPGD